MKKTLLACCVAALLSPSVFASNGVPPTLLVDSARLLPNGDSQVIALDPNTGAELYSIDMGGPVGPWGVAFSPDGSRAYLSGFNLGTLSFIDIAQKIPTYAEQIGNPPQDVNELAITPDGKSILQTEQTYGNLAITNVDTKLTELIPVGHSQGVVVSPDGKDAFVNTYATNNITKVNLSTLETTSYQSSGLIGSEIAISHDGKTVCVPGNNNHNIAIYSVDKPEATPTIISTTLEEDAHPFSAVFSKDDRYIYVSDSRQPILFVVDVKTSKIIRRINVNYPLHQLVMSKDGNTIFGVYAGVPAVHNPIDGGVVKISNIGSNNPTAQLFTAPQLSSPLGLALHE